MIEQLANDLVFNQICINSGGKSAVVKCIFMPNLEGSSLVEFKYVKIAQTQLMPINEFKKIFSKG